MVGGKEFNASNNKEKLILASKYCAYVLTIYAICYSVAIAFSGIRLAPEEGLSYAWDWRRVILSVLILAITCFVLLRFFPKNNEALDSVGSSITLHSLTVITFIFSIGISVFSSEILTMLQEWLNRTQSTSGLLVPLNSASLVFVAAVMTILLLFLAHAKHSSRLELSLREERRKQNKGLRDAIRVAPPPYFTEMLADMSDQAEDFLSLTAKEFAGFKKAISEDSVTLDDKKALAEEKLGNQRKVIKAILTAFARLARTYDNVNPNETNSTVEYRANLMLNLQAGSLALNKVFDKVPEVRFEIPFSAKPEYYLVVDKRLSVKITKASKPLFRVAENDSEEESIEPNDFTSDKGVKNALLPVYWSDENEDFINYNMIGAPLAIATGEKQFIPDTYKEIELANHYPNDIKQRASTYFREDKKGRSIVSLPVATRHFKYYPDEKSLPNSYMGTINLYRNKPDIFSGHDDNFQFFTDFTRPLSLILGRVTELHIATLTLSKVHL